MFDFGIQDLCAVFQLVADVGLFSDKLLVGKEGEMWGGGNFRGSQVSWYIYVCRLGSRYTNKNH